MKMEEKTKKQMTAEEKKEIRLGEKIRAQRIETKAKEILERAGYTPKEAECVDIFKIARKLGYEPGIILAKNRRVEGGYIHLAGENGEENKILLCSEMMAPAYRFYIMAYLMAYAELHKTDGMSYFWKEETVPDDADYDVYNLALAILMPFEPFCAEYAEIDHNPDKKEKLLLWIATKFTINVKHVEKRLEFLKKMPAEFTAMCESYL